MLKGDLVSGWEKRYKCMFSMLEGDIRIRMTPDDADTMQDNTGTEANEN